jgi:hypothetical protein
MLPPRNGADVIGVQPDGAGVGRRAAVAVDEVLRDPAPQIVPDADVGDVRSILAAIRGGFAL